MFKCISEKKVTTRILLYLFIFLLNFSSLPAFALSRPENYPDRTENITVNGIKYKCELWNKITSVVCLATVVGTETKDITSVSLPQKIQLPNSSYDFKVYRIGNHAFANCENLTSIVFNKDLTIIEEKAFLNCLSLNSITFNQTFSTICKNAFQDCKSLETVSFPRGLFCIGYDGDGSIRNGCYDNPFKGCTKLTTINVDADNNYFSSVEGALYDADVSELCIYPYANKSQLPSTVKTIGTQAFYNNDTLTGINVPPSLSKIKDEAFYGCSKMSGIEFPETLTEIGDNAFRSCESLTAVRLPNSVTALGERAFEDCSSLSDATLPENLQRLRFRTFANTALTAIKLPEQLIYFEGEVFYGCTFEKLVIPETVEYIDYEKVDDYNHTTRYYPFEGLTCKIIYILADLNPYYTTLYTKGLNSDCIILAYKKTLENTFPFVGNLNKGWKYGYAFEELYTLQEEERYLTAVEFSFNKINAPIPDNIKVNKVTHNGIDISPNQDGLFVIENLEPGTTLSSITYKVDLPDANASMTFSMNNLATNSLAGTSEVKTTQTKAVFSNVNIDLDKYTAGFEKGIYFKNKQYPYKDKAFEIDGLNINSTYSYLYYIAKDGQVYYSDNNSYFDTKPISMSLNATVAPTSIAIETNAESDEVKLDSSSFTINSKTLDFVKGVITGLDPETSYTLSFTVKTSNGSQRVKKTVKTSTLELKTLKPKCVSESCAIVAAETNISDFEPNVGFEWKKYDAPESLLPSEGYGAVCDGILEGYIKNLQSTSFYNVRPFYKNASGTYYYGEWITFDPSDFSYFEPTVHTYAATDITHTSAAVRGYVMAGTDDIISQGFEYWPSNGQTRVKAYASGEKGDVKTVLSTGQVMTATLADLESETEYVFRAFVTTSAGTKYGEEQTFTTISNPAGIAVTIVDKSANKTVIGYYDMNGNRYNAPQKGFNIILYSDGSSNKIFVR